MSCGAWTAVLCRRPSFDGSVIKGKGYKCVYCVCMRSECVCVYVCARVKRDCNQRIRGGRKKKKSKSATTTKEDVVCTGRSGSER